MFTKTENVLVQIFTKNEKVLMRIFTKTRNVSHKLFLLPEFSLERGRGYVRK